MLSVAPHFASRARTSKVPGGLGRWLSAGAGCLGLLFVALLVHDAGVGAIASLLRRAGGWLPLVVLLHLPQTLCSAAGWGALLQRRERPPLTRLYLLRWIRESVNSLLPVAQVGGEVVRARLLARCDVGLARAGASCALDVTLELLAQLGFTVLGLALLAVAIPNSPVVGAGAVALLCLAVLVVVMALAQRLIRSTRVQALAGRPTRRWTWSGGPPFRAAPGQQLRSTAWHFLSWLLGALEAWATLHALGLNAGLREAVVVESLGQMVRVFAFAVPGAVGVQEGGFILICGLFGAPPAAALGVSLIRRLREAALGSGGLLAWRLLERAPAKTAGR